MLSAKVNIKKDYKKLIDDAYMKWLSILPKENLKINSRKLGRLMKLIRMQIFPSPITSLSMISLYSLLFAVIRLLIISSPITTISISPFSSTISLSTESTLLIALQAILSKIGLANNIIKDDFYKH